MFFPLRILSILVISMVLVQQTFGMSQKRCNGCHTLLTEAKRVLESTTEFTQHILDEAIQGVCSKYIPQHLLVEVCDYFGEGVVNELFKFFESMEQKIDVVEGCQHIHLCPPAHP